MSNIIPESLSSSKPLKLGIRNIGPISDAKITLSDITLLFGPPNTGKSYTLKSIYSSLLPLDKAMRDLIKDPSTVERILDPFISSFETNNEEIDVYRLLNFLGKCRSADVPLDSMFEKAYFSHFSAVVQKNFGDKVELDVHNRNAKIFAKSEFTFDTSLKELDSTLRREILSRMRNILPYSSKSHIFIEDKDFLSFHNLDFSQIDQKDVASFPQENPFRGISLSHRELAMFSSQSRELIITVRSFHADFTEEEMSVTSEFIIEIPFSQYLYPSARQRRLGEKRDP